MVIGEISLGHAYPDSSIPVYLSLKFMTSWAGDEEARCQVLASIQWDLLSSKLREGWRIGQYMAFHLSPLMEIIFHQPHSLSLFMTRRCRDVTWI
uniref:Uncharacterized protein n=1 Tax=Kalanchoe fedtschenkoi TaxID=63787 RepID=A0A7N0TIN4_KALFE